MTEPLLPDGVPFIALPAGDVPWALNFRSTWIVSSLVGLRKGPHFEHYQAQLGKHRDEILTCIAGIWLPMAAALEHYRACEQLGISDDEYVGIAKAGGQVRAQWNARVIADLRADSATPWDAMTQLMRTWKRSADGGAFGAYRLEENQARATYVGCELFDVPYFRRAVRLMIYMMCSYKGKQVRVRDIPAREPASASYLVTWQ